MPKKESSLVFVRSERLGRKYVLYSQCFELVVFCFCLLCFSFSPNVPIYNSFGEAPLSSGLASRKAWILASLEKWVLAVIHRKTEQVYRTPADFLESSRPSCTAVSHLMLLGTDTRQKDFRGICSFFPVGQSIKFEECLTL